MQMLAHSFCEPPVAHGPRRLGFRAAWWEVGITGCVSSGVSSPLRVRVSHCAAIYPYRGACDLHMPAEQSPVALLVTSKMEVTCATCWNSILKEEKQPWEHHCGVSLSASATGLRPGKERSSVRVHQDSCAVCYLACFPEVWEPNVDS